MTDEEEGVSTPVLVYRLVSLAPDGPWGGGLLLELAEKHEDDASLQAAIHALLAQPWVDDPRRQEWLQEQQATIQAKVTKRSSRTTVSKGAVGSKLVVESTEVESEVAGEPLRSSLKSSAKKLALARQVSDAVKELPPREQLWGEVLLHGRGTVGETVLHLCLLLYSPNHRRLGRLLIPYLANKQTKDLHDEMVQVRTPPHPLRPEATASFRSGTGLAAPRLPIASPARVHLRRWMRATCRSPIWGRWRYISQPYTRM